MKKYVKIVLLYTLLTFLLDILNGISELLFGFSFPFEGEEVKGWSLSTIFLMTVILAPLLETAIYQTFFFVGLMNSRFFNKHRILIVFITAILFGLSHYYTLQYVFFAMYGGFVLSYAYIKILYMSNDNHTYATFTVVVIHCLRNLIAFLLDDVIFAK